jgi:hypothetical protein
MEETNAQEVREAEVVETSTAPAPTDNKKLKVAALIIAIGVVVSGGLYFMLDMRANTVAVVNGFKITQEAFQSNVDMIMQNATLSGADVTDPVVVKQINDQALDILINNALLIEGAKAAGISADEAEVATEYETLVTGVGGAEELAKRMEEVGLTEEKLRSNIKDRLVADAFIEAQTDIENLTVTDEEVTAFLETISTEGSELPPLEEIKPQIEAQILSQKQQALVTEFLKKLRDEATVDIRIEEVE